MRNRVSLHLAAAGVVLLASTASAQAISVKKAYPKAINSNGNPVAIAGSNGTAAWLSRESTERNDYFLHILKPGEKQASKVAVQSNANLYELAIEATGDGKTTVVAVASESAFSPWADIVSIDPASGAVAKIEGAANPDVDERAPALGDGTLSFSSKERAAPQIKQVPVTGGKVTTFARLPIRDTRIDSLTAFPGNTKKLGIFTDTATVGVNGRGMSRLALGTITAGGKIREITARTQRRGWSDWFAGGPYVDNKGDILYAAGRRAKLYRVGDRKPLREITFGAEWVGGDLGLLSIERVKKSGPRTLRATGPLR